jgi:hypothetical protein
MTAGVALPVHPVIFRMIPYFGGPILARGVNKVTSPLYRGVYRTVLVGDWHVKGKFTEKQENTMRQTKSACFWRFNQHVEKMLYMSLITHPTSGNSPLLQLFTFFWACVIVVWLCSNLRWHKGDMCVFLLNSCAQDTVSWPRVTKSWSRDSSVVGTSELLSRGHEIIKSWERDD